MEYKWNTKCEIKYCIPFLCTDNAQMSRNPNLFINSTTAILLTYQSILSRSHVNQLFSQNREYCSPNMVKLLSNPIIYYCSNLYTMLQYSLKTHFLFSFLSPLIFCLISEYLSSLSPSLIKWHWVSRVAIFVSQLGVEYSLKVLDLVVGGCDLQVKIISSLLSTAAIVSQ